MAKESLVVHVRKLLFKKYMKIHKMIFFNKSRGKENNIRRAYTFIWLKKKKNKKRALLSFYSVHDIFSKQKQC